MGIKKNQTESLILFGAVNGARTRDPQLGKLMLYQLSYYRVGFSPAKISIIIQCCNFYFYPPPGLPTAFFLIPSWEAKFPRNFP